MLYNYNNYSFDIVFNSDDFIIQIEDTSDDNKLYSNIYTFEEIKNINNIFSSIDIIEKLIKYCLDKKEDYVLNITNSKIIKLHFNYIHDFIPFELILDIFPIRKDLSTNTEIITLKKTIKYLENKINNLEKNNINNSEKINKLLNIPNIYNNHGCVCFSKLDLYSINMVYCNSSYGHIISEQDIINPTDLSEKGVVNINDFMNNYIFNYYKSASYHKINTNKILNYNIHNNINFELLNLSSIIFYDIDIYTDTDTDNLDDNDHDSDLDDNKSHDNDSLCINRLLKDDSHCNFNINKLNDKIKKIIFVNCKININTINNLKNCHRIIFYKCNIISIDGLYKYMTITIKIIDTKTDNIMVPRFSIRASIENTHINSSYILLF